MYVDETYYNDVFKGEPVESAGFSVLCQRAGEIVEELTLYRLTEEALPDMCMNCEQHCTMENMRLLIPAQDMPKIEKSLR